MQFAAVAATGMSDPEKNSFDDPALKAAIRRAWGADQAPPTLRERVMSACGACQRTGATGAGRMRLRVGIYGLATAALVLIAVGLVFYFHRTPTSNTPALVASALPATLADELVARHDGCCRAHDHHMPGLSHDDFTSIQRDLHQKLGFPILSARLPGTWNFHGASICPVGKIDSGHLVFEQGGNEFVSVFSLPRGVVAGASATGDIAQVEKQHPIAGFATADGFYCIVGSSKDSSLSLDKVRTIRDQLRPDVALGEGGFRRLTIAASH